MGAGEKISTFLCNNLKKNIQSRAINFSLYITPVDWKGLMMFRKIIIITIFTLAIFNNLRAESNSDPIKVGVGIGTSSISVPGELLPGDGSFSSENTNNGSSDTLSLSIQTKPHKNLFFELSYIDFGDYSSSNVSDGTGFVYSAGVINQKTSLSAYGLSVGAEYAPRPNFNLFVKTGVYESNAEFSGVTTGNSNDSGSLTAFGIEKAINKNISVKMEIARYSSVGLGVQQSVAINLGTASIDVVSLNIMSSF